MKNNLKFGLLTIIFTLLYSFISIDSKKEYDKNEGIQFQNANLKSALKAAQEQNKIVFVDVYASWCGPCKMLDRQTFSNKKVGEYFNNKFISVKINGETSEGREIMSEYQLRSYPTLLFLDEKGNVISKNTGFHSAKELLELGKNTQ